MKNEENENFALFLLSILLTNKTLNKAIKTYYVQTGYKLQTHWTPFRGY